MSCPVPFPSQTAIWDEIRKSILAPGPMYLALPLRGYPLEFSHAGGFKNQNDWSTRGKKFENS